jgi:hypothetical protein
MGLLMYSFSAFAQYYELPTAIRETFSRQYPKADSINYTDNLLYGTVAFWDHGNRYTASYTKKGVWKGSEQDLSFDKLPNAVKDGFAKSKYADWKVEDTKIVYRPGDVERYRLKVAKSDLQKKYLYFNEAGRLVDDEITL